MIYNLLKENTIVDKYEHGKLAIRTDKSCPKDFVNSIKTHIESWTKIKWQISIEFGKEKISEEETTINKKIIDKNNQIKEEIEASQEYIALKQNFPKIQITKIEDAS